MRLSRFLEMTKQSDAEFGAKCRSGTTKTPIHRTRIWSYRTARSRPNADHIAAIEVASDGKVTAKDFAEPADDSAAA